MKEGARNLSEDYDLDIGVFQLANGKVASASDVVYHKNKTAPGIRLPVDQRSGGGEEVVYITLADVSTQKTALEVWVSLHEAAKRNQGFEQIARANVEIIDETQGQVLQAYNIADGQGSLLHVGTFSADAGRSWSFQPSGDKTRGDFNTAADLYL